MPEKDAPLIWIVAQIASIWIAAEAGFHILLPAVGIGAKYNDEPIAIAVYYSFWIFVAIVNFWHLYKGWRPVENRQSAYALLSLIFAAIIIFIYFVFPLLPAINWAESWDAPEVMLATPWYFLPKSIDILLQQLLISALVLAFFAKKYSLRAISWWSAFIFGGAHLLLVFWGLPLVFTMWLTLSAVVFALIFPRLILKTPNGFLYSYALHWLYYALTVITTNLFYNFNL
ncbi:MAG: hypothetical protein AAB527_02800 [Patescibacteria group bacterium]